MRPPSDLPAASFDGTRFRRPWQPRPESLASSVAVGARAAVGYVTFWTAVWLPVLIVGLLASGIGTVAEAGTLAALILLEVLALVVGRAHLDEREAGGDR